MIASGYLHMDVSGYGGLQLTEHGIGLLREGGRFLFRRETLRPKSVRPKVHASTTMGELTDSDRALLAALKRLRLQFAKERGVPAYAIFRDRSLVEMAAHRPSSEDSFAQVYGVGTAKLRDFAAPFMEVIAGFD